MDKPSDPFAIFQEITLSTAPSEGSDGYSEWIAHEYALRAQLATWLGAWEVIGPGMLTYFGKDRPRVMHLLSQEPYNLGLDDLGRMAGVTRERVRQILSKYRSELRRAGLSTPTGEAPNLLMELTPDTPSHDR